MGNTIADSPASDGRYDRRLFLSFELSEATPPEFSLISTPRPVSPNNQKKKIVGGGTAFLIHDSSTIVSTSSEILKSFELSSITIKLLKSKLTVFNIYRNHYQTNTSTHVIIIIILVLHLRLSSKLPQRRMRLCSVLEKFSFKQFFKHRKSYVRVLHTGRETVPGCWTSMKESTRANCLGGGGWHKQVTRRRRSQV